MLNKIFYSERYIGKNKKNGYFEGWYFRTAGETPFAFIVGVSRADEDAHSFIQYVDTHTSCYFRFNLSDFSFEKEGMTVKVANNFFSLYGIYADLNQNGRTVAAALTFSEMFPFKKTAFAPSAMGPFSYLPVPCSHAVISLSHTVNGALTVGGATHYIDAKGYIEKDFGYEFPKNYLWTQFNFYETSVMCAVAWPFLNNLRGFICLALHEGRQYNLSLYTGAKLHTSVLSHDAARFAVHRGKSKLAFEITNNSCAQNLLAPQNGGAMTRNIKENLSAQIKASVVLRGAAIPLPDTLSCAYECVIAE
ncbi:MAG: hypothetical protein FWH03_05665 [Firmicutes bacterium]|nr:hypothetical protein [Bacillota bacterium]